MEHAASSELLNGLTHDAASYVEEFECIVKAYQPKIFRFMLTSLRDRDAAENLTQDCFLKACKARDSFRKDCSISTWLMRIAVNLIRDHERNRRLQFWRQLRHAKPSDTDLDRTIAARQHSPEAQALLKEEVNAIWQAAALLPERQRTVFLLRFVEDMQLPAIASATGLQEGTVKVHLFRAVRSIRDRLGVKI